MLHALAQSDWCSLAFNSQAEAAKADAEKALHSISETAREEVSTPDYWHDEPCMSATLGGAAQAAVCEPCMSATLGGAAQAAVCEVIP